MWTNGTKGTCQTSGFGDGGHVRCSMGPTQSLERVFFSLKSPFLRGVQRHILGLQCDRSGCNFWLEWLVWINGTWGTCQTSRFGDGVHARCTMGPKQLLETVFFSLKYPHVGGGFSSTFLASSVTQVAKISCWNDLYGSMGPKGHVGHLALVIWPMPTPQWVPNSGWRWSFLAENLHVGVGGGFSGH